MMIASCRKRNASCLRTLGTHGGDKDILESRLVGSQLLDSHSALLHCVGDGLDCTLWIRGEDIEVIAITLHVDDCIGTIFHAAKNVLGSSQVRCAQLQSRSSETPAKFVWRAEFYNRSSIDEGDAATALGFVKIRRRNQHC